MPRSVFTKHTYTLSCTAGNAAGTWLTGDGAYWNLSANSIYDPYPFLGGRYAYGFETLAPLYARYIVYGVKVEMTWTCLSDNQGPFMVGVYADPQTTDGSSSALTNMLNEDDVWNSPNVMRRGVLQPYPAPRSSMRMKWYTALHKMLGCTKAKYSAEEVFYGTSASSPVSQPSITIFAVRGMPTGAAFSGVHCTLRLTYYTRWIDSTRFHNQGEI